MPDMALVAVPLVVLPKATEGATSPIRTTRHSTARSATSRSHNLTAVVVASSLRHHRLI